LFLLLGYIQNEALVHAPTPIMTKWSYISIIFTIRNVLLLYFVQYVTRHKLPLSSFVPREAYPYEFHVHLLRTTAVESLTHVMISEWIVFSKELNWIVYWIPLCFLFEIVFDFFHYFAHRFLHHPLVYRHFHKIHHTFLHPIAINAFYQDPIDLLLSNSLPTYLALSFIPSISYLEWNIMLIYKNFIEIAGHSGKVSFPISSFPQFIWLPKWLGMELYTEDHDLHHSLNNCNYAKRFSLWDRVFGTYSTFKQNAILPKADLKSA